MGNVIDFNKYTIPNNLITTELEGLYGKELLAEMAEIIKCYEIYEKGAGFNTEGTNGDYVPSDVRFKIIKSLVDKQARFLFSKKPDFTIVPQEVESYNKEAISNMQNLVDAVMKDNRITSKLTRAAKDAFIGKRVACILNFNDDGISLRFIPSLEFIYDVSESDENSLSKIVCFYTTKDSLNKVNQRIYRKRYWMEAGFCHFDETIFDGNGNLVENIAEDTQTKLPFIPAVVILNDGLTGDLSGESEVYNSLELESLYSKMANNDIDSQRKNMNAIRYVIDGDPNSTKDLSIAPGAFWDIVSDNQTNDKASARVGSLETNMTYKDALAESLGRIKNQMYEQMDLPNIKDIQAQLSSGKALKAIYWGLIVRCDEKMNEWGPALEFIVKSIIEGAKIYPNSIKKYNLTEDDINSAPYEVKVENQYSLPEDESDEKLIDMQEVNSKVMSKKTYMKKWQGLTDAEAEKEIEQIMREQAMEDSFGYVPPVE